MRGKRKKEREKDCNAAWDLPSYTKQEKLLLTAMTSRKKMHGAGGPGTTRSAQKGFQEQRSNRHKCSLRTREPATALKTGSNQTQA